MIRLAIERIQPIAQTHIRLVWGSHPDIRSAGEAISILNEGISMIDSNFNPRARLRPRTVALQKVIHPAVIRACTRHGISQPAVGSRRLAVSIRREDLCAVLHGDKAPKNGKSMQRSTLNAQRSTLNEGKAGKL
jgi:hypothetical protein